jgi:hypothetical protein
MVLSHVHLMNHLFDDALIVGRAAVALRPNCTNANGFFANVLHYCGRQSDAIEHVTWAIRYSPVFPPFFADVLSLALLFSESFDAAAAVADDSLRLNPGGLTACLVKVAACSAQNKMSEAGSICGQVMSADPVFSLQHFAGRQPYKNRADIETFVSRLSAAGLPA